MEKRHFQKDVLIKWTRVMVIFSQRGNSRVVAANPIHSDAYREKYRE